MTGRGNGIPMRVSHFTTGALILVCLLASTLLSSGQSTQTSDAEALTSLRERADHGVAEAQLALGKIYYYGEKAPRDFKEAAVWFRKAADQGNASAQFWIGHLYLFGQGLSKDT